MVPTPAHPLQAFQWTPQPDAEAVVRGLLQQLLEWCGPARELARRMADETGTRLFDWVDHLAVCESDAVAARLEEVGFRLGDAGAYEHPEALFPRILLRPSPVGRIAIKVDAVADFLAAHRTSTAIDGDVLGPFRQARAGTGDGVELWVVERHGFRGFAPPLVGAEQRLFSREHLEAFRLRRRTFADEAEGFAEASRLIEHAIADLGRDWTCDLFFQAERDYWTRRNRAARVQRARQDALGLGWANHDHHTYRSSREWFAHLIAVFEQLGFTLRERFYAGREAGWGAQIVEQRATGITIFADVDMSADELQGDFAHTPLAARRELGTVGLWCGLHGEAFLQAGMHHLECQFDFDALRGQLEGEGVGLMKPFTSFPYLRQAFTEGERWAVEPARIGRLQAAGRITREQAERFRSEGAVGSHLENLERNEGFKGFNQTGINEIILGTDPRRV